MSNDLCHLLFLLIIIRVSSSDNKTNGGFIFNQNSTKLDGSAKFSPNGLLTLTNATPYTIGHAFHSLPFAFKSTSSNGSVSSFSSVFIFAIIPFPDSSSYAADGLAFIISPTKEIEKAGRGKYIGFVNQTSNGNSYNHVIAIEFDTFQNEEFEDIDSNHVGVDINSLTSVNSSTAGFYADGEFNKFRLASGDPIQAWVDYDGDEKVLNVTLSPIDHVEKPSRPVLSVKIDISPYVLKDMYVGFSSATGTLVQRSYILAWSFQMNGRAQELDLAKLPSLPYHKERSKRNTKVLPILTPAVVGSVSTLVAIVLILFLLRRKAKFAEVLEDWEVEYGPHRFIYKDLYKATKGFNEKELLGSGGFGQVYRGVLPKSKTQIAVKRISHNSAQGMKEFVAEIATIGRIRHPNLVRLQGYCRRKSELFLVYDYMPNASLDKFIFDDSESILNWEQRFNIIKDVASVLAYLHEEWVEVIIHRDIKASNVLLDGQLNGKLGDFGLARSIYPGNDLQTTQIAGTIGYMAPELARNGKANTKTDVFAFGAFCLEVACGRRPAELKAPAEKLILMDWVAECWKNSVVWKTADPRLGNEFESVQMEMVLKLGLICTHFVPHFRPSMSQVKRYLDGDISVIDNLNNVLSGENWRNLNDFDATYASVYEAEESIACITISEMFNSMGR